MISLDKEVLLLNKLIYNTVLDINGLITTIEIMPSCSESRYIYYYRVYYDDTKDRGVLFTNDLTNGTIKFLIPNGPAVLQENWYRESVIKDLKEYFGENYNDDLIFEMPKEEKERQTDQMIKDLLNSLDSWNEYKKFIDKN